MARARNIKPAFFTNELLGVADPMVCLTFAGLWCLADKIGVLEDRPLRIKAELFPYRDSLDVNGYLTELARLGFIIRYQNGERKLIKVCNFRKHQSPHHTEKAKGFPLPNDHNSLILEDNGSITVKEQVTDGKGKVPERSDSLIPDSGFTDSLIPGERLSAVKNEPSDDAFSKFWAEYPNKKAKPNAVKAWAKLKVNDELFAKIMDGLARYKKSPEWTKDFGSFIPHPATWLNAKRWEDEVTVSASSSSRHHGFDKIDYSKGLGQENTDGSFNF